MRWGLHRVSCMESLILSATINYCTVAPLLAVMVVVGGGDDVVVRGAESN